MKEYTNFIGSQIFDELAKCFNFTLKRKQPNNEFNIYTDIAEFVLNQDMSKPFFKDENFFRMSSAIFFDFMTYVVPPGKPLSDMERMFAAFDDETWVAIGVTFAICFVVIQIINLMSTRVQNFVFGQQIRTPTLNIISIFLTGGQPRTPGRNFARFLLTLFTVWSLIFRTCYQSMMFRNLNSDMRHPRVKTYKELVDKNFTLLDHVYHDING